MSSDPNSPSLIIFDCDGVLVDTETQLNQQLVHHLAELGVTVDLKDCFELFVGKTMSAIQDYVGEQTGKRPGEDWVAHVREHDMAILQQGVDAIDGAREIVETLQRRKMPYCVASSGRIVKMTTTLTGAGLFDHFKDVLFSAEMVGKGKPAPDLFLYAAATMGHAPETCLVIEDSLPGVQAAVAAGMPVLGYAGNEYSDGAALQAAGATLIADLRGALDFIFQKAQV